MLFLGGGIIVQGGDKHKNKIPRESRDNPKKNVHYFSFVVAPKKNGKALFKGQFVLGVGSESAYGSGCGCRGVGAHVGRRGESALRLHRKGEVGGEGRDARTGTHTQSRTCTQMLHMPFPNGITDRETFLR